ncbi:MAG: 1-acyl-sn-glycerol-3-phosphate acyltransferase, partial [Pseudomonadota bacterium]
MSPTWQSADLPDLPPITAVGHALAVLRTIGVVLLLVLGTVLTLMCRGVERLFFNPRRPLSAPVVQYVWRATLKLIGLSHIVEGPRPIQRKAAWQAIVANHVSWLDIIALGAAQPVVFVSKADVAR